MRRWFCYFFVTFENDVLKSPFLSCFLRYKFIQVPSSAQLKMKMTQISSGSFFILEPADEFLETQWFQGLACRLGRLAACRPLDDARPIFRKSFRGLREIKKRVRMNACIQDELFFVFISKTRSCDERSTECVANPVIRCYITCTS